MGSLRFLLAVVVLPFAWALALVFLDVFRKVAVSAEGSSPIGLLAFGGGFISFLIFWWTCPKKPVRLYVLGHELTHAVWGLAFGARVSNLKVSISGGSVTLTKSNVFITLAPYFFPFYTMLVVLVALIVRCFATPLPGQPLWLFAVGFTWCLHVCFTLRSLTQRQPDVIEYGRLFSWVFIWLFNVLGVLLWILATTEISCPFVWNTLVARTTAVYGVVCDGARQVWSLLSINR